MSITTTVGISKLMQFLSEYAAINQFVSNFNNFQSVTLANYINSKCRDKHSFGSIISSAFDWEDTPEGIEYWGKLSVNWRRQVRNNFDDSDAQVKKEKMVYNSLW